ncbi:Hypothetical protein PHPALM_3975 [Phytophthora palmivora]|uniref:PiggyBac transposable element-derived protein domain-containing protein n=1 Tax=Phytophthora palmivora TaxID=4796 RepID=A0A2P4YL07_9STRA|nr:Hypothetical protein PHPALM_3975 [Phytophthora palmivora]
MAVGSLGDSFAPTGTFGCFNKRERFESIMLNLHFSDNIALAASTDKTWKVRPVVEILRHWLVNNPYYRFDETIIPSWNTYNPMHQFVKDKPPPLEGQAIHVVLCADNVLPQTSV